MVLKVLATAIRKEKEIKLIQFGKKEIKVYSSDDIIQFIKKSRHNQKANRTQWIQQGCKIQNQYTEIYYVSIN